MDSDNDMFDMESGGDDYYYSDEEPDYEFIEEVGDSDITASHSSKVNYVVVKEDDVRKHQADDIVRVSTVLSVTETEASVLLLHYKWNVSKVDDEWFADEDRVRTTIGMLKKPVVVQKRKRRGEQVKCEICFDSFLCKQLLSVSCGHPYCSNCWNGYITTSIKDGPGCLLLKCPEPGCSAAVSRDMVEEVVSEEEDKKKFYMFFRRSYVESNKKMKWCPAPGCEHAVDFAAESKSYDVLCLCLHRFCWNCIEEAHRPVDCDTVIKWIQKNSVEAENTEWLLANTKPCPKCHRAIEKNHGCMHMSCSAPCRFEFCWLCLGDWKTHGEKTGGFFACNRYEAAKQSGKYDADVKKRENAKNSLERYTHYYERWLSNHKSRLKAKEDLERMQSKDLKELSDIRSTPETQLQFIIEAWLQIIECRQILKWTYAYGYYLLNYGENEFFEYLQGEAESGLERLHACAEKELKVFQEPKVWSENLQEEAEPGLEQLKASAGKEIEVFEEAEDSFKEFQYKLTNLTAVTKTYFANLVKALENGLES